MGELLYKQEADALSKLIQLQAGRHDIRLTWSGVGTEDLVSLCNAHAVRARMSKHLWDGMRDLMMMPDMKTLPEAIQAQIMSTVLKAQALVDLDNDAHAKRMANLNKPKPGAA